MERGVSASSEWNIQLGMEEETDVRFLLADGPREERICGELRSRDCQRTLHPTAVVSSKGVEPTPILQDR